MIRITRAAVPLVVAIGLSAALAGCGTTDRIVASSIPLDDYTARHPIVLAQARSAIDVFPSGASGRLDRHTAKQIYAFAVQYQELGRGRIVILVPRGRSDRAALADIRHILAVGGANGAIDVATYPVVDPGLASPIRNQLRRSTRQGHRSMWPVAA